MTYKVNLSSGNNYSVKISQPFNLKSSLQYTFEITPMNIGELSDVELSGNNYDKYVLMYDSATGKWVDKNPDEVLSAATTELDTNRTTTTLPSDFEDQLDIDLDDRIDLDAGNF